MLAAETRASRGQCGGSLSGCLWSRHSRVGYGLFAENINPGSVAVNQGVSLI